MKKKNAFLRAAVLMLALTMVTSCFVGGTFAKYTTADNVADTARVAKWGVTVITEGSLFAKSYADLPVASAEDTDQTITVQVADWSTGTTNVVAPGTKNETGMTFTITGIPEVDVDLKIEVDIIDIVLPAGTYKDPTTGDANDEFETEEYHPVKFTLTNGAGVKVVDGGTLAEVEAYLEALDTNEIIESNTDLSKLGGNTNGTYTLTWEWDFEGNDEADTLLGNIVAELTEAPEGCSTDISFEIRITATQVN